MKNFLIVVIKMNSDILSDKIIESFTSLFNEVPEIPNYIIDNIYHNLRPYQKQAIINFIFIQQKNIDINNYPHTMFHMATGSGKTSILAAVILYMFHELKINNFMFFVNSDAIIKKTKDNLINVNSDKYLFNKKGIFINNKKVEIKIVEDFPVISNENEIYLKLTTIQKLHNDLNVPHENGITYNSLKNHKVVLLSDEAHHINAWTKNKKELTKEQRDEKNWENTVKKILMCNPSNQLIEFTATINLENEYLYEKYHNKIVYQYDLTKFMNDGYSKNVILLQSNEEDKIKILNAILLSQFRKYIAKKHNILLKPVILFKSNTINTSLEANNILVNIIDNLNVENFNQHIDRNLLIYKNSNTIWEKMFDFYKNNNIEKVINDLKWDFSGEKILNANKKEFLSEENTLLLNSLESINNPIRVIFAVAKLNEGWDVLNLYDIVRINEGASITKKATDSEAQLIGRGARYFPFEYLNKKTYYRRFDKENTELKLLENLYYHTINENTYIKRLESSLEAANIQINYDKQETIQTKLKKDFKQKDYYKYGYLYSNKSKKCDLSDYKDFSSYNISKRYELNYEINIEHNFNSKEYNSHNYKTKILNWKVNAIYKRKAMQLNPFFRFDNLKKYFSNLRSASMFINSKQFLGDLELDIILPDALTLEKLTANEKLMFVTKYFNYLEIQIKRQFLKEKGLKEVKSLKLSEIIDDYEITFSKIRNKINIEDLIQIKSMRNKKWYVFEEAVVNGLELSFINFFENYVNELYKRYDEVYLIRNERKLKLLEFDGNRGFMPDFILILKNKYEHIQLFIEPKGEHLVLMDKWKEELMIALENLKSFSFIENNKFLKILGTRFFRASRKQKELFEDDLRSKLNI